MRIRALGACEGNASEVGKGLDVRLGRWDGIFATQEAVLTEVNVTVEDMREVYPNRIRRR